MIGITTQVMGGEYIRDAETMVCSRFPCIKRRCFACWLILRQGEGKHAGVPLLNHNVYSPAWISYTRRYEGSRLGLTEADSRTRGGELGWGLVTERAVRTPVAVVVLPGCVGSVNTAHRWLTGSYKLVVAQIPGTVASLASPGIEMIGRTPAGLHGDVTTFTVRLTGTAGRAMANQTVALSERCARHQPTGTAGGVREVGTATTNADGRAMFRYRIPTSVDAGNVSLAASFGGNVALAAATLTVPHVEIGRRP